MRVAFAGTHRTGKTTLVEAVGSQLPAYAVIEEPYRALEAAGYDFADPPSSEDFERQLRHAIDALADAPADALFDRSPLDFVAYLQAIGERFDADEWLDDVRAAMEQLRRRVDELVQDLLLDDPFGFGTATLEVAGRVDERVRQVMRAIAPR